MNSEIVFDLTDKMQKSLITFFDLESKLKNFDSNRDNLSRKSIEEQMDKCRKDFINEFKKNNKEQIFQYLKTKYKN